MTRRHHPLRFKKKMQEISTSAKSVLCKDSDGGKFL
jgi:hypothetical protein